MHIACLSFIQRKRVTYKPASSDLETALAGFPAASGLAKSPEVFYRKLRQREALN